MNLLCISLAGVFLVAGLLKVARLPALSREFRHANLPSWSLLAVGIVEVVAAVLLLVPGTGYLGATLAILVLTGATITTWIKGAFLKSFVPLSILALTFLHLWQMNLGGTVFTILLGISGLLLAFGLLLFGYSRTRPNVDGEREILPGGTEVIHHFRNALGVQYHYVTAGAPELHPLILIPGAPESWYCWHHQITGLHKDYYVIALDLKPYGQTDKDLDGKHDFAHIAAEIADLINGLGIQQFHLGGHDRGAIAADNLLGLPGISDRVTAYVRMQQSFDQPHGEPLPPHKLMASFIGTLAFSIRWGMWVIYRKSWYVKYPVDRGTVRRITKEWRFANMAQAVPQSFKTTSFPKELKDREDHLFSCMTMPILLLQGRHDPGQHPEEYENSHLIGPNTCVQFIEAGHFFHLEHPEPANEAINAFLAQHTPNSQPTSL